MKPIFGICKDDKRNNDDFSARFLVKETPEELCDEYGEAFGEALNDRSERDNREKRAAEKKSNFWYFTIIAVVSAFVLGVALFKPGLLTGEDGISPVLLIIMAVYLVGYIGYLLYTRVVKKNSSGAPLPESEEIESPTDNGEDDYFTESTRDPRAREVEKKIYAYLGVPEGAPALDVFYFRYTTDPEGGISIKSKRDVYQSSNGEFRMFCEGESFCMCDTDGRYELPLSAFSGVMTDGGEFVIDYWLKDTPFDDYAQFGARRIKGFGGIETKCVRGAHIFLFDIEGERYGLYVPDYDAAAVKTLLGVN